MAKTTILVADDSADDIFFLSLALEESRLDCFLMTVADGEEAIAYLSNEPLPDLLLLDLKMPKVTGFEVLQWIRKTPKLRSLPVVVWSNSTLEDDKKRAIDLGATDYVVKIADRNTLDSLLKDWHSRFLAVT